MRGPTSSVAINSTVPFEILRLFFQPLYSTFSTFVSPMQTGTEAIQRIRVPHSIDLCRNGDPSRLMRRMEVPFWGLDVGTRRNLTRRRADVLTTLRLYVRFSSCVLPRVCRHARPVVAAE